MGQFKGSVLVILSVDLLFHGKYMAQKCKYIPNKLATRWQ